MINDLSKIYEKERPTRAVEDSQNFSIIASHFNCTVVGHERIIGDLIGAFCH